MGIPWPKFTDLSPPDVQQGPVYQSVEFRPVMKKPSARYFLPNFVDFVNSVTDKKTVNDMSAHSMRRFVSLAEKGAKLQPANQPRGDKNAINNAFLRELGWSLPLRLGCTKFS